MTIYDLIIAGIFVGFMFWGFSRGIIREAFETIGLILGVYLSFKFATLLAPRLPIDFPPQIEILIAGALIAIGIIVVARILGWIIYKGMVRGPLRLADRFMGATLGAIKAIVLVLAIIVPLTFTPFGAKLEAAANKSSSLPLKWSMAAARPIGKYLGSILANTLSNKISAALPIPSRELEKETVQELIDNADKLKDSGLSQDEIVQKLKEQLSASGKSVSDSKVIGDVLRQVDQLKKSGLSLDQAKEVMTNSDLDIKPEVVKDLIGKVQEFQLSGLKPNKEEFMNSLDPETRKQIENVINNPVLRDAMQNVDPVEFAKQTGVNLQELVKQLGMDELYEKLQNKMK